MEIITTREAYEDAIKVVKSESDFDFGDGCESIDHGWKARIECIAKNRKVLHYLFITNDKFGFDEAETLVTQWKKNETEYLSTYVKSYKNFDPTYENVKARLSLLLISCTPKNVSDYPSDIQDDWIHLGPFFCQDLFDTVKTAVDESDWRDWGPYWRSKYYRLKARMEMEGLDSPKEEEDQDVKY